MVGCKTAIRKRTIKVKGLNINYNTYQDDPKKEVLILPANLNNIF